jgi:hypothetical protein
LHLHLYYNTSCCLALASFLSCLFYRPWALVQWYICLTSVFPEQAQGLTLTMNLPRTVFYFWWPSNRTTGNQVDKFFLSADFLPYHFSSELAITHRHRAPLLPPDDKMSQDRALKAQWFQTMVQTHVKYISTKPSKPQGCPTFQGRKDTEGPC